MPYRYDGCGKKTNYILVDDNDKLIPRKMLWIDEQKQKCILH